MSTAESSELSSPPASSSSSTHRVARPPHLEAVILKCGRFENGHIPQHGTFYTDLDNPPLASSDAPAFYVRFIEPVVDPPPRSLAGMIAGFTPIVPSDAHKPFHATKASTTTTNKVKDFHQSFRRRFPQGVLLSISDEKTGKAGISYRSGQHSRKLTVVAKTNSTEIVDPVTRGRVEGLFAQYMVSRTALQVAMEGNDISGELEQSGTFHATTLAIANAILRGQDLYDPESTFPPSLLDLPPQMFSSSPLKKGAANPDFQLFPRLDPSSMGFVKANIQKRPHSATTSGEQAVAKRLRFDGSVQSKMENQSSRVQLSGVFMEMKRLAALKTALFDEFYEMLFEAREEGVDVYLEVRSSGESGNPVAVFVKKGSTDETLVDNDGKFALVIFQFFCQFHSMEYLYGILHNHEATLIGYLASRDVLEFSSIIPPSAEKGVKDEGKNRKNPNTESDQPGDVSDMAYSLLSAAVDLATEWEDIGADRFERNLKSDASMSSQAKKESSTSTANTGSLSMQ